MKPQRLDWQIHLQATFFHRDRAVILGIDNNHGDAQINF
jgi:hypothetical protein